MRKLIVWKLLAVLMVLSTFVSACGTPAAAPTKTGSGSTPAGAKITSSGFACPEPQDKAEVTSKELNLFVWTEYIPQDMIDCFQLVYDIKVNRDEYSSNEDMYAKLSAGGVNYDLALPTDYIITLMIRQDMLEKIDTPKLTAMKNFDPNYLNLPFDPKNEYTVPYEVGTDALIYDAETVSNPPVSWADLWRPEYANNIVLLDDSRVAIGFTLLTLGYDVNTTDPKQLDEAKVKLADLVKNVKLFDSDSPKTALIAGDVNVGSTWTGEAYLAHQEKPSLTYVYPTEGAVIWQDNWVIPKGAGHTDAIYAWLNYINQGDVFWLMLRDYTYVNPNQAALDYAKDHQSELYQAYMDSPITNVPEDARKKAHRIEDVGEALKLYDQIWTEVKGGS